MNLTLKHFFFFVCSFSHANCPIVPFRWWNRDGIRRRLSID
jgi:hypothetical protein